MAYIVSSTNASGNAASPQTVTLPSHTTGDLLLIAISQDGGTSTIATSSSGWAMLGTQAASGGCRMAWGYKIAASGAESNPSFTGDANEWAFTTLVIRDAHATTPFGASPTSGTDFVRTDWNAAWSADTGSLTTGADDCLLIYGVVMDTDNNANFDMRSPPTDVTYITDYLESATSGVRHWLGYSVTGPSGATAPVMKMYFNDRDAGTQQGGNTWVLAVRNKASGTRQPACRAKVTSVGMYGDFYRTENTTWQAPSNFAATIATIGVDSSVSAANATDTANPPGFYTQLSSSLNTADQWVGGSHTITSTDMTGKVFQIQWQVASLARIGSNGWAVGFSDGTNWVVYQLCPLDTTLPIDTAIRSNIALGNATALASSGSINWAAVTRVAYIWHRNGSAASTGTMNVKNAVLMGTAEFVGGGASLPAKFSYLPASIELSGYRDLANLQGSGQVLGKAPVQIGDGSTATYFNLSASSFEYPQAYDATSATNRKWNAAAGSMTLGIYPSASDTLAITAGVLATSVAQALTVHASASTSATVSFSGTSMVGWTPTWKTGIACNNATFQSCAIIDFKGADITNVTANSGTGTALISASSGFSATGCTFTASTTAVYGIRIAAAGTFDLASTTFSGFTKDIDVTATTGTVTINLADGQATPTYQTAGATVTLVSSPVFQTVTITGFTAGSRIWIKDVTSGNVLFNGTASAGDTVISGSSCVWTDPSAASASRQIAVRVAYVSTVTAKTFVDVANIGTCGTSAGSESVNYIVAQEADTTYDTNGIDGPAVYATSGITFTDAATDRVNCNIGGGLVSWPTIYACFVYWMFTSSGIDDDNTYITAPDPANYILTAMKIRNDSAVDLVVSSGWGRDTTGSSANIIDTAGSTGNIFLVPEHVVAYATGSGVTAQNITDIAAASAAASATAVWATVLP